MIIPPHYFKRSTLLLLLGLAVVVALTLWAKQYLAISNTIVMSQTDTGAGVTEPAVVKDIPIQTLLNDQVLHLQPTPKSSYAAQVSGRSSGGVFVPGLPAVSVMDAKIGNRVVVSWYTQAEQVPYDGVLIYRAMDATTPGELITTVTTNTTGNYYDTTVTTGQTYYYYLQTFQQATPTETVKSSLSSAYSVTVTDSFPPLPPAAIKVTLAESDPRHLLIQWDNNFTDTIVENKVYRSTVAGKVGEPVATISGPANQWVDTSVQPDTKYYYTVSAIDDAGNESTINLPIAPYGNATPFVAATLSL